MSASRRLSFDDSYVRPTTAPVHPTEHSLSHTPPGRTTSGDDEDEVTPPLPATKSRHAPRDAWSDVAKESRHGRENPAVESAAETGRANHNALRGTASRAPPIPAALLALPRSVVVAAMRHKPEPAEEASHVREAQRAIRAWNEQDQLLKQRAELLGRAALARGLLSDRVVAEPLGQVLEEAAQSERARKKQAAEMAGDLRRARELSHTFRELVTHVMPGVGYLSELQEVMQTAEAQLLTLRGRHTQALQELGAEEASLSSQLDSLSQRMQLWDSEDPAAPSAQHGRVAASRLSASRIAGSGVVGSVVAGSGCGGSGCVSSGVMSASGASSRMGGKRTEENDGAIEAQVAEADGMLARLGGPDCGWDGQEHAAYMRLRTQLLGTSRPPAAERVARLVERAAAELPGRDVTAVEEHEERVAEREAVVSQKRELLTLWRRAREEAARSVRSQTLDGIDGEAGGGRREAVERDRREREEARQAAREAALAEWKARREGQREQTEVAKQSEQKEAAEKALRESRRRAKLKAALAERSSQRAEEETARAVEEASGAPTQLPRQR